MIDTIFHYLIYVDRVFWGYVAFVLITILGTYLTIKNRFYQIRQLPAVAKTFFHFLNQPKSEKQRGVHPLKAFFASVGGMIGVGNLVGIVTAIQIGGPGALFWVWVTGMIGAIIKYSEIYLGIKYRVENKAGGYDGGPIYFLKAAYKTGIIPTIVAFLICIYGVEVYLFKVVTDSVVTNWHLSHTLVISVLLGFTIYAGFGGVKRVGRICSWVMPFFMIVYLLMCLWIIGQEVHRLPAVFIDVFQSAFNGHAAVGGFAGAGVILAIQHGMSRAAYSADIGIGYDSIIQSESSTAHPEKQARLAILGVFLDSFICTLSILLVLVSGIWKSEIRIDGSQLVQTVLGNYFPYMHLFMPIFLIICGYTTLIAYFCVGLKSASYLAPRRGKVIYTCYAIFALVVFSFVDQTQAIVLMSITGSLLLIINLLGIFLLRREVLFFIPQKSTEQQLSFQK